jgi:hypothetical protein
MIVTVKTAQWEYVEYSTYSRKLAQDYTRSKLQSDVNKMEAERQKLAESHFAAIKATSSMQSNSARRAHTGNSFRGNYEKLCAYIDALEIYDYYPQHTKEK